MYLKRLELHGYKSFANRTELVFNDGVTAIVGPNGSGKSNIADAIQWVLGEQSFSNLRAKKTEDMIFAGSASRVRMGMAEVSMTLDNGTQWLPIEFSEVTVTRRAYRSGENDYLLNGTKMRLRDINELLSKGGLGRGSYTVIGQGLIDSAISLRPEERRTLLEDAAGISIYQSKKADALGKLKATHENLTRVADILHELGPRVKRLHDQANRAGQFAEVQRGLAERLQTWYGFQWQQAKQRLDEAGRTAARAQAELLEARQALQGSDAERAQLRERIQAQRAELDGGRAELGERQRAQQGLAQRRAVADERHGLLVQQHAELLAALEALDAEERSLLAMQTELGAHIAKLQNDAQVSNTELIQTRQAMAKREESVRRVRAAQAESQRNALAITQQVADYTQRSETARQRLTVIAEERAHNEQARAALAAEVAALETRRAAAQQQHDMLVQRLAALAAELQATTQRAAALQQDVGRRSVDSAQAQAQARAAKAELESARGRGIADLLQAARSRNVNVVGALASLYRVAPEHDALVRGALGPYAGAVVVQTWDDARRLAEGVRTQRVILVADSFPPDVEASSAVSAAAPHAGCEPAVESPSTAHAAGEPAVESFSTAHASGEPAVESFSTAHAASELTAGAHPSAQAAAAPANPLSEPHTANEPGAESLPTAALHAANEPAESLRAAHAANEPVNELQPAADVATESAAESQPTAELHSAAEPVAGSLSTAHANEPAAESLSSAHASEPAAESQPATNAAPAPATPTTDAERDAAAEVRVTHSDRDGPVSALRGAGATGSEAAAGAAIAGAASSSNVPGVSAKTPVPSLPVASSAGSEQAATVQDANSINGSERPAQQGDVQERSPFHLLSSAQEHRAMFRALLSQVRLDDAGSPHVTPRGDLIGAHSIVTPDLSAPNFSALEQDLRGKETKAAELSAQLEQARHDEADTIKRRDSLGASRFELEGERARARSELDATTREAARRREEAERMRAAIERLAAEHERLTRQVGDWAQALSALQAHQSEMEPLALGGGELSPEDLSLPHQLAEQETRTALLRQELQSRQQALAQVSARLKTFGSQRESRALRATNLKSETAQLADERAQLAAQLAALAEAIDPLVARIQPVAEFLQRDESALQRLETLELAGRERLYAAEASHSQALVDLQRRQDRQVSLREQIESDYEFVSLTTDLPVALALELDESRVLKLPHVEAVPDTLEQEIRSLKNKMRWIGNVNLEAPSEYALEKARLEFLNTQSTDLQRASESLHQLVQELDQVMQHKFRETFDAVARAFKEYFTKLFGGGSAELVLTDPANLGESGIEILAHPPGKRRQPLGLLSGGERALTAGALVFALLRSSPTPFCVLDEVDAALDEANVGRFRMTLREISERTQFIVVTHNRSTVEVAGSVYGISMGSDGASQMISLRLDGVDVTESRAA